jgi:2-isopropylmalate synthase
MVKLARSLSPEVEFSAEDASRSERTFLCRVVEAVIAAGATTVNIPDTVGYAQRRNFAGLITTIRNRVPNIDKAVISVHCHNDLGMAVPTPWPPCAPGRARSNARSTAWASGRAMRRSKRSS